MMKSWITFLLPKDEYKEKRMLYFISEGAVLLFLTLVTMAFSNTYFNISMDYLLVIPIGVFLIYILGRYILSGIEYADVVTEESFKQQRKKIMTGTVTYMAIYMLCSLWLLNVPGNQIAWLEITGIVLIMGVLWFSINYISLKRSYQKNRDLD